MWLDKITIGDIDKVGGKNASLGGLISELETNQIHVPEGFATTVHAYNEFLSLNNLKQQITSRLDGLDVNNLPELSKVSESIQDLINDSELPPKLISEIKNALEKLQETDNYLSVAVRSSATNEDLDSASFAGQQKTLLNIEGLDQVLIAVKKG